MNVRAVAVQLSPVLKIEQLAREGVQFATFPETVVPYYRTPTAHLHDRVEHSVDAVAEQADDVRV